MCEDVFLLFGAVGRLVFSVDILCRQLGQELILQEQKSEWEERRKPETGGPAQNGKTVSLAWILLGVFP